MRYFPEGWNTFRFLITPAEFREALAGFHHVTFCCRVPLNYRESPPAELFATWERLYRRLQEDVPVDNKKDRDCFDWADGLTDDLAKCSYGPPFLDPGGSGVQYRLADFDEPCVGIQPFAMIIGEDGKLYTKFHYSQFPQKIAGLELQYPKKIAYFAERGGYSRIVPCGEAETYCRVYQEIVRRVKGITVPLRFSVGEKEYRPSVRISPGAREAFPGFWFAREYKISLPEGK